MEKNKKENWKRPISLYQLEALRVKSSIGYSFINTITLEAFLRGYNPDYGVIAGKIKSDQIQRLKDFSKQGSSHINFETMGRFLQKENPFGEDYVSLQDFVEQNGDLFFWNSVSRELKEDESIRFPSKICFEETVRFHTEIKRDMNLKQLINYLGTEKYLFERIPTLHQVYVFLKSNFTCLNKNGNDNFFPLFDKDKDLIFLRAWVYNGITNVETLELDPIDYFFQKGSRFFLM